MAEWIRHKQRNEQIRQLRVANHSIPYIARLLGISKATVSYHCRGISVTIKRYTTDSGTLANAASWERRKQEISNQAEAEWCNVKQDPKMMGFLGIYWGEGTKRSSSIGIVNNDPGIISIAVDVFRALSPNAKLDAVVRCYPDHDKLACEKYWSDLLLLDVRVVDKKWAGSGTRHYSTWGLCSIRFSNWVVRAKILTWIRLWREEAIRM